MSINLIYKNSLNNFIIALIIFLLALLSSCSDDCPLEPADPVPPSDCRTQTLTEFIPTLTTVTIRNFNDTQDSVVWIPVPEYAIEYFEFPGIFYNTDDRYTEKVYLEKHLINIASLKHEPNISVMVLDKYPLNDDIKGDVIVDTVVITPNQRFANLRFYGRLNKFNDPLNTEDCTEFYSYLNTHRASFQQLALNATRYGENLPGVIISSRKSYNANDIFVINQDGRDTSGNKNMYLTELLTEVNLTKGAVSVTVRETEVYYYISRSGKHYAVVITEIRQSPVDPFRKRVTIMFNPL